MQKSFFSFLLLTFIFAGSWNAASDASAQVKRKNDPAFNRYITQESLDMAVNSGDPHVMTDAAMQLAEGERVLHRPHAGISAEDMMISATRIAARKGDTASIERLKNAAQRLGRTSVIPKIDRIAKSEKRVELDPPPNMTFRNEQEKAAAHGIIDSVNHAVVLQDHRHLDHTEKAGAALGELLSDKVGHEIDKFIHKAKGKIDKRDDDHYRDPRHDDYDPARDYRDSGGWGPNPHNDRPDRPQKSHEPKGRVALDDPNNGYNPVYESRRLKAQFVVDPKGARITCIHRWSPLYDNFDVGDIITDLDGMPVNSSWELENHVQATVVDYISHRHGAHKRTKIYIH